MKIIGIICEYNPFHNGHIYHLNKIKEKYPDSLLILCLNGYFLERGDISIIKKYDKVKIALLNNIDIVIELPTLYGCQSADNFAKSAITLLDALNVDTIIFGSETNNINYLMDLAKKQTILDQNKIKINLKEGNSYPKSLLKALNINNLKSNDLLGIAYSKAILKEKLNIKLETILRTNDYNDLKNNTKIVSAKNIREKIKNNQNIDNYLPNISKEKIQKINIDLYFKLLKHKILTDNNLNKYLDVNEGIENLLIKQIKNSNTYEEFLNKIKSKRYSINRLNRMLLHINLGILKKDANKPISYLKILGFNSKGKNYLKKHREYFKLPTKIDTKSIQRDYELKASILYDLLTNQNEYQNEIKNIPIYINTADCLKESNQK